MNDIKIIRLFNPDLNNISNQILIIDLKKKKYNDRILSIQNFMEKYSYYNNDEYKYFYPILANYSKLDLMVYWHNIGLYNNEYCSCNYFLTINPTFNLEKIKNKYIIYSNYTLIQCIKEIIKNNLDIIEEEILEEPNINLNETLEESNINLNETLVPNINLNETLVPNINLNETLEESNINNNETLEETNINNNEIFEETNINLNETLEETNINNNEIFEETNINNNNNNNNNETLKTKYIDFNLEEYKKLNKNIFFENDDDYLIDYEKNKKNRIYSVFNFLELNPEFTINIYDVQEENIYNKIINPPIITFIIPSIGRETLKNTIISLQKLKNPNWECIIVFDGIKQNIEINDNRISIYEIEKKGKKNYGGFVRNFALQMDIKSNWVGFVDDDDTISDKYIDYLLEDIQKYKCIDVLIFRMMYKNGVVLPDKNDKNIVMNKVGISFAINKRIFRKKKYFFKNNSREDYCFLRDLQIKKYKMLISSYVAYFINMEPCITNSYSKILIN
jgi:hypothetical protein